MAGIRHNLKKIYAYKFLSEFYLIAPILIPFYLANGLSATQVFAVQATYALSILVMEIPSGYLADVIGRKRTLILGAIFLPLGLCVYAFSSRFMTFALAEFLIAVGNSMRSGSDSALIYDTLLQLKQENDYRKYEGRTQFFTRVGTSSASVAGGLAAVLSLRLPFYINIGFSLMMLPLALSLTEPERPKRKAKNPLADIFMICAFGLRHPRLRLLILQMSLLTSTSVIGIWAYFLYYSLLKIPVGFFGILFASTQLVSAFGSPASHRIASVLGMRRALQLPLLIGFGFIALGLFRSPLLIAAILVNMFLWNCTLPLLYNEMNLLISSDMRATLLSAANMSGSLGFAILSPLFGKLVDAFSLSRAFIALGVYFLIFATPVLRSYFRLMRNSEIPPASPAK